MTRQRVVWQSPETCEFLVVNEGPEFRAQASPCITENYFGLKVGLFYRQHDSFAYWESSTSSDLITAWRVMRILPLIKRMRNSSVGYDGTVSGLVQLVRGDRREKWLRRRAQDFEMTVEDLAVELDALRHCWPAPSDVYVMWDRLSDKRQDEAVASLREAAEQGNLEPTPELTRRLSVAELRLRTIAEQKQREDRLINKGLAADVSLRQMLQDIGVTNLLYTAGSGEALEPSHFDFENLDAEIMRYLIGTHGFRGQIQLLTSERQPDDPSAHQVQEGSGVTIYSSDFGTHRPPRVVIAGEDSHIITVRWDRVTERFVLTLRPPSLGDSDVEDTHISVADLRRRIGFDSNLDGPLPVGQRATWSVDRSGGAWSWLTG